MLESLSDRDVAELIAESRAGRLLAAHRDVGGDVVSAGGTGTYHLHDRVTEVQAGSYALKTHMRARDAIQAMSMSML